MKKLLLIFLGVGIFISSYGQQLAPSVIASAGDYFTGSSGSLSWTLGEGIIETFKGQEATLTQGFQQSYYTLTEVPSLENNTFNIHVYPNPAKDIIHIGFTTEDEMPAYRIQLYDMMGNILLDDIVENIFLKTDINLSRFSSNIFFLNVTDVKNKTMKSFKILKVNF